MLVSRLCREVGNFEHSLVAQGVQVIKFWLDVSDEEQDKRLAARLKHRRETRCDGAHQ